MKAAVAIPAQAAPELSTAEKISLFRALFRGREDVFAVRWESGEKAGYSPASIRDWTALPGVSKTEWKKRDKATRQLLPLTDQAIHDHLSGKTTIGVYPLLPNETCWFLAVDFDQKTWKDDASPFVDSCREWNVPSALERSRSGSGAHVWVFFAAPVAATFARRLGTALLTRTMERRHQMGLGSYDRLFPNRYCCFFASAVPKPGPVGPSAVPKPGPVSFARRLSFASAARFIWRKSSGHFLKLSETHTGVHPRSGESRGRERCLRL
jgi:hypothetical protein